MAVGKNKRLTKGKKGAKKKTSDVFLRKEWYDVKTPFQFAKRNAAKTLATKSTGLKMSDDSLKGRVFDTNLADINDNEDMSFRKIQLEVQEVQGRNCLTDFHGMSLTRDKQMFMIRKWHSLIECHTKIKTTDGYYMRVFAQAFTMRTPNQVRTTCYAGSNSIRRIRKIMVDIIQKEGSKVQMRDFVKKLLPESLGTEMEKACKTVFPLQNCMIRKVKMIKKPKFDLTKLMELHQNSSQDDFGVGTARAEADEAKNTLAADMEETKKEEE